MTKRGSDFAFLHRCTTDQGLRGSTMEPAATLTHGEIDEVVVGRPCWLHLERLDDTCYDLHVGDFHAAVSLTKSGKLKITVHEWHEGMLPKEKK